MVHEPGGGLPPSDDDSPIPKILHFIWLGSEPSRELDDRIAQFRILNPDFDVRLWRDSDLRWLSRQAAFDTEVSFAGKSDIARYEILLRFGGYYIDCDFQPLRSISTADWADAGLLVAPESREWFSQGILAAPAQHSFLSLLVRNVPEAGDWSPDARPQTRTGPIFFTENLNRWRSIAGNRFSVIRRDDVYPYGVDHIERAAYPLAPSVLLVHRWSGRADAPNARLLVAERVRYLARMITRDPRDFLRRLRGRATQSLNRGLVAMGAHGITVVPVDVHRVLVTSRRIGSQIMLNSDLEALSQITQQGTYDDAFRRFLRAVLSGSDVYVDVGCNVGQFTLEAAKALSDYGRVYGFEPNPLAAATAEMNAYLGHVSGGARAEVHIQGVAIAAREGWLELCTPLWHAGRATHSAAAVAQFGHLEFTTTTVRASTLDTELGFLSHVRLMKVDTEGSELAVLKGAQELISSGRVDFVDVEWNRSMQPDLSELMDLLLAYKAHGAQLRLLDERGGLLPVPEPNERWLLLRDLPHLIVDFRASLIRSRVPTEDAI